MNKIFTDLAWQEYLEWQFTDRKMLKKINDLIKDIERNGNEGIGKPEPLRHELEGYWSRRISPEHRLVYRFDEENVFILRCKTHYD